MLPFRFVIHAIGFAMLVVMAGFGFNYVVDPYSVFGTQIFPEFGQLQERYLKIEWLKKHPDYNTILIGSSRIGVIRTEDVNKYFEGSKAYNLTISQANQWDIEKYIDWLVKNIPNLSHVIVQIDWPSSYGPKRPDYALMDEVHPDISGRSKFDFLMDYLTFFNMEGLKTKININHGGIDQLKYDMSKGYWSRPLRDKKIDKNCANYVANEISFHHVDNHSTKSEFTMLTNNLDAIGRYKKMLVASNIKLTLMLTPHNHLMIDKIEIGDLEYFIRRLVGISDFYNFMYYNKLTKNDCNYYESSHYRPNVGEIIVRTLSNKTGGQSDIHQYVSETTLESHLDYLKANFSLERTP
jgi:hypothetical protein